MTTTKGSTPPSDKSYVGLKKVAKKFAITIPKLRKAMKEFGLIDQNGQPYKDDFAQTRFLADGTAWYLWDEDLVLKAIKKFGLKKPDKLTLYSHVQNKFQAEGKIDEAFYQIGSLASMDRHSDSSDPDTVKAHCIFISSKFKDIHAIGGPCAVQMISDQESCAKFVVKVKNVLYEYHKTCRSLAETEKDCVEIDFYRDAINNLVAWVQLQYFR